MEKVKFAFDWLRGVARNAIAGYPEVALWLIVALIVAAIIAWVM